MKQTHYAGSSKFEIKLAKHRFGLFYLVCVLQKNVSPAETAIFMSRTVFLYEFPAFSDFRKY